MTCREAERLVMPYINGSITDEELKEFLKHIETCEDCREELEIYFTVETALELSRQRVHTLGILETARYAVNTLCFWAVLAVLVLQFRMW